MDDLSMDDDSAIQFSMGDLGDQFNFQEGINFDDDLEASLDSLDTLDDTFLMEDQEDLIEDEDLFEISEDNMESLQDTLRALPLNLKLNIQDSLSEADLTSERYRKLVELLIKGSTPRVIANEFFNVTGKKIQLPKGYQRQSGRVFEKKKTGFVYQFKEKGWPLLRIITLVLVGLGFLVYLSFQFLYRPLQALVYYNQGLDKIEELEFDEAREYFNKAYFGWTVMNILDIEGWPMKGRFLDYARAFSDQRSYNNAQDMYEGLIGEYQEYIEGYLEFGKFLTQEKGEYDESAEILSMGLDQDMYNYDLMLALGDTYLEWSREDPARLEDARYQYASVMARYNNRDEVVLRMLRYFLIRKDDQNIRMMGGVFQSKGTIKADPYYAAETIAKLGGYFIDTNEVSEAKDYLLRAEELDATVPEVHYQLARYFNKTYNTGQEKSALQKALFYLDQKSLLTSDELYMNIDIHRRRGEMQVVGGDYGMAENEFLMGIQLLENSRLRGMVGSRKNVGLLYADMGNLIFDIHNDLGGALEYFTLAEQNQYTSGNLSYKKGYILYDRAEYDKAVLEFEKAAGALQNKRGSHLALANTMLKRQNLFGARSMYNDLLRDLKLEESSLPYLAPEDIIEHRSLVNYFILVYNNLGYLEYQLSKRSRDPQRQSQALVYLTKAADYADRIDRDPNTGVRTRPEESLVFLNTMALLRPLPETDIYMMDEIPRDPEKLLLNN